MRIIKQGLFVKHDIYRKTCPRCLTQIEYDDNDFFRRINWQTKRESESKYIECPCCHVKLMQLDSDKPYVSSTN